ncbi:MAG: (deoxy)nucleoside triphosphate pyrophosphohydrolase [Bryobacteraceae bacterium]
MTEVVAAILEREGRVLIGRRQPAQSHPLKWEFPGGKVEPGESPAQALARELEEELGIREAAGDEIARYQYTYPGRNAITLIFFRVSGFQGEPRNLIFHELRWEPRESLGHFDFVEGDLPFLRGFAPPL